MVQGTAALRRCIVSALCATAWACAAPTEPGVVAVDAQWRADSPLAQLSVARQALVLPASVVTLRATVRADDMDDLTQDIDLTALGSGATAIIILNNVPKGSERVVQLVGLTADGLVAFFGESDPVDVEGGKTASTRIELTPSPGFDDVDGSGTAGITFAINGGAQRTNARNVTVSLVAGNVTQMRLFNGVVTNAVASCGDAGGWVPYAASSSWDLPDADGTHFVSAMVKSGAGHCSLPLTAQVELDRVGPVIDSLRVNVADSPPGIDDSVSGQAGAVEGDAAVEVFGDAALTQLVASSAADAEGGFAALSLGDNYSDEVNNDVQGQASYWLRATDDLGNPGAALQVDVDVTPPVLTAVLDSTLINGSGVLTLSVTLANAQVLAGDPLVELVGSVPSGSSSTDCSSYVAGTRTYSCIHTEILGVSESEDVQVLVMATEAGAQNSRRLLVGTVRFDVTPPGAPDGDKLSVTMQPAGQPDQLAAAAGAFEPNSTVVLYTILPAIPLSVYSEFARVQANAGGGFTTVNVGDNTWSWLEARQIDAAGNDPCPSLPFGAAACPRVTLLNDSLPPSVMLDGVPDPTIYEDHVTLQISASDNGPYDPDTGLPVTSLPVTIHCAVDGGPEGVCAATQNLTSLAPGVHRFAYWVEDALGNATSLQEITWRVQVRTQLYDGSAFSNLSVRGYHVDAGGMGHAFVGGDNLYHFYETAPGMFAREVITAGSVSGANAAYDGSQFYVVYAREDAAVEVALGSIASWSTEVVASADLARTAPVDISLDGSGVPSVVYAVCPAGRSCFNNGPDYNNFEVWLATRAGADDWGAPAPVSGIDYGYMPQLQFDAQDDLWLGWFHANSYFNSTNLRVRERTSAGWQAEVAVSGAPPNATITSLYDVHLQMLLTLNDYPALSFRAGSSKNAYAAIYNGATWAFRDLGVTSQPAGARGGSDLWFALNGPFNGELTLQRYDGVATTWTSQTFSASPGMYLPSLAVVTPGTLGTAEVHVAHSYGTGNLSRTILQGGSATLLSDFGAAGSTTSVVLVKGAAEPMVVWHAADLGQILLRRFQSGTWQAPEVVVSPSTGEGISLDAVSLGSEIWVAHISSTACGGTPCAVVDYYDGGTWSRLGNAPYLAEVSRVCVDLDDGGNPVLAYQTRPGTPQDIWVSWWNASSFVEQTVAAQITQQYAGDLGSIKLLGDTNGSGTAGGKIRVFYVTGAFSDSYVVTVEITPTGESPGDSGACTTCAAQNVLTWGGSIMPNIAVGLSPASEPVLVATGEIDDGFGVIEPGKVVRLTYSTGAWARVDVSDSFVLHAWDDAAEAWVPDPGFSFSNARFWGDIDFVYDGAGRMAIGSIVEIVAWPYDFDDHALMREQGGGAWNVYPFARSAGPYINPTFVSVDLAVDSAITVWPDGDVNDLWAIREEDL